MRILALGIVATFCLTLFFPLPRSAAADSKEEAAAIQSQIDQLQVQIDQLKALQAGQTASFAPLALAAPLTEGQCGQASAGSCGTAVGARSGGRRGIGLFRGRLFGGRRAGGCG